MRERLLRWLGAALWLLPVALCGCEKWASQFKGQDKPKPPPSLPPAYAGTVREFAVYDTAGAVPLQGYGLVVGLGKDGSREVPEFLKDYLVQYLSKHGIGKPPSPLTPMTFLRDPDKAIVRVSGSLPFGAPIGTPFDIDVAAIPTTQTRSLQGGTLMPTDMALFLGSESPTGTTKALAVGTGAVLVNAFVDPNNERELVKWRQGRVLGGGRVSVPPIIQLVLRQPDFARAGTIARRINETFRGASGARDVANALNRGIVEIMVPRSLSDDYEHFLELVLHVPLTPAAMWESRARELVQTMEAPDAGAEECSLVLEAMGRNTIPVLRTLYASRNSAAAFYAARTGGRLGDEGAEQVLVRLAGETGSPFQVPAIEELGRNDRMSGAMSRLQSLIDDENNLVRIAAYEALVRRHDDAVLTRFIIRQSDEDLGMGNEIKLDLVKSRRSYVIYATQTLEPRIALFGADMSVNMPVFFCPPEDSVAIRSDVIEPNASLYRRVRDWSSCGLLTTDQSFVTLMQACADPAIRPGPEGAHLAVFRKMPNGKYTDVVTCEPTVRSLIVELASMPERGADGAYHGLRMTYGQVLSAVYRMCQNGDIPAKFSLQSGPSDSKIHGRGPAMGRPDVPE